MYLFYFVKQTYTDILYRFQLGVYFDFNCLMIFDFLLLNFYRLRVKVMEQCLIVNSLPMGHFSQQQILMAK